MTAWAQSLIRISNYEVETLQKRLAEITERRANAEIRIAVLDAEAEGERNRARMDAEAGMMLGAYLNGWKSRKAAAEGDLTVLDAEEAGARDALTGAFEELKKFEHVAETTRLSQLVAIAKRETAAFDELGGTIGRADNQDILEVTLTSTAGAVAKVITWGAVLRDLTVPLKGKQQRVDRQLDAERGDPVVCLERNVAVEDDRGRDGRLHERGRREEGGGVEGPCSQPLHEEREQERAAS